MVILDTETIVLIVIFVVCLFWLLLSVCVGIVATTKHYRPLENLDENDSHRESCIPLKYQKGKKHE